jgi:hypothetical protein
MRGQIIISLLLLLFLALGQLSFAGLGGWPRKVSVGWTSIRTRPHCGCRSEWWCLSSVQ